MRVRLGGWVLVPLLAACQHAPSTAQPAKPKPAWNESEAFGSQPPPPAPPPPEETYPEEPDSPGFMPLGKESPPEHSPAPLPTDIPDGKPECCAAPLVISINGRRWRPRSAWIFKSSFEEGMLAYSFSDKTLGPYIGCTEGYPAYDRHLQFLIRPGQTRLQLDPAQPLILTEYRSDPPNPGVQVGAGQVALSEVTPEYTRGSLQFDYSADTWAIGSFEAKVCP